MIFDHSFSLFLASSPGEGTEEREPYIPKDLDDAHAQMFKEIPNRELEGIRAMESEEGLSLYHFGMGMGMRNGWGLWKGSRLARYFNALGVEHPDDMSAIILDTFWCKLRGKPFELEKRIAYYQEYWAEMERLWGEPDSTECPACGSKMSLRRGEKGLDSSSPDDVIQVYGCPNKHLWFYCNSRDRRFYLPEKPEDRARLEGSFEQG